MTDIEIDSLLEQVVAGAVAPKTALSLMVVNGEDRRTSAQLIFRALGGDDATEVGPDGRTRYVRSGRLVAEVEAAIGEATSSA